MSAFKARRTAVLAAVAAVLAGVLPLTQSGADSTIGVVVTGLGAVGAGGVAYVTAYQAIGLTEKVIATTVVASLASVASGLTQGLGAAEITVLTALIVLGQLGVQAAAPSTEGSVAIDARWYGNAAATARWPVVITSAQPGDSTDR